MCLIDLVMIPKLSKQVIVVFGRCYWRCGFGSAGNHRFDVLSTQW